MWYRKAIDAGRQAQRKAGDTMAKREMLPRETIERRILFVRGQKVMLDSDLAELYGVETSNLNKAVKRNIERFPADFMFQLNREEAECLRFQDGTSKPGRGGRRYLPYALTEQGVAMLVQRAAKRTGRRG